jgi:hypothetical protein
MNCPDEDSDSFQECIKCGACKPDRPVRVGDFLEMLHLQEPEYTTIAEGVMA